jgi:hypothetical protein
VRVNSMDTQHQTWMVHRVAIAVAAAILLTSPICPPPHTHTTLSPLPRISPLFISLHIPNSPHFLAQRPPLVTSHGRTISDLMISSAPDSISHTLGSNSILPRSAVTETSLIDVPLLTRSPFLSLPQQPRNIPRPAGMLVSRMVFLRCRDGD